MNPGVNSTIFVKIKPLRENTRDIDYRLSFLRNISSLDNPIQFFIKGNSTKIELFVACLQKDFSFIQSIFYASYPDSELIVVTDESKHPQLAHEYFHFTKQTVVRSVQEFKEGGVYKSPFHDLLSIYNIVDKNSELTIHFTFWFKEHKSALKKTINLLKKIVLGTGNKSSQHADTSIEQNKDIAHITPELWLRAGFSISGIDFVNKKGIKSQILLTTQGFINKGKIITKNSPRTKTPLVRSQAANFFHIPTADHFTKALDYAVYRKLPYPYPLPTENSSSSKDFTLIGTTDYRNDRINFGILDEDKFRHMYIVGKTGTGKSTFLSNLITSDIINGKGVGLIDPHGELVDLVLDHIPSHRTNDVILFNVADDEFPIGFNLLQAEDNDEKNRIVSGVVTTFQKLFAHSRGPRLEYILRNVLLTLVSYPNATMMHILRILTDNNFRKEVLSHTTDSLLLKFRNDEYNKRDERRKQEAIGPITNKIGQFLSSSVVRNIFGQPKSKLNLREAMDNGKIVLINLSKGKIGEDNASMIGSLLVTKFQIDAMSRADIANEQRKPFYLYIDEFQNFATDSFATILSEARKYKLALIMANQYTSQLSETVRDAIFGNIGSTYSFTIGYDDAVIIAKQFKDMVTTNDLISLPRFTAYTRMMINGITSDPFSMKTMPLQASLGSAEQTQKIIAQSRQRYAMPRAELEKLLNAWQQRNFSPAERIALRSKLEGQGISKNLIDRFIESGAADRESWYRENKGSKANSSSQKLAPETTNQHSIPSYQHDGSATSFSVSDIVLGKSYQGYIKLQFNYGLFVTVKGVEGLLHRSMIVVPEGVNWKKYFNIGDTITVIAKEFKIINGEKKVVRSMK